MINLIKNVHKVCFVGDSVTEGTKNGGVGWYEPLATLFPEKEIIRYAKGSQTSKWLQSNASEVAKIKAELYVIALGCNDIRYRNYDICAMTAVEYINNIRNAVATIKNENYKSSFVFIAPWCSLSFDANFRVEKYEDRVEIYKEYTESLEQYCQNNGYMFINPNPLIFENIYSTDICVHGGNELLKDFIHPNAFDGVVAYSEAVILSSMK